MRNAFIVSRPSATQRAVGAPGAGDGRDDDGADNADQERDRQCRDPPAPQLVSGQHPDRAHVCYAQTRAPPISRSLSGVRTPTMVPTLGRYGQYYTSY